MSTLKAGAPLPEARPACRCLREFIDANVEELDILLNPDTVPLFEAGEAQLSRFPRVTSINLKLDAWTSQYHHDDDDDVLVPAGSASALLILPFAAQPLESRLRVRSLKVCATTWDDNEHVSGPAMMSLALLLPNLRSLSLGTACRTWRASFSLLPGIEVLAEKLTCLSVTTASEVCRDGGMGTLSAEALASVRRLGKLRTLRLRRLKIWERDEDVQPEGRGLLGLLNDPPPGLECLELWDCRAYVPPSHQEQHLEAAVQLPWLELGTPPPVLRLRSVLVDGLASNAEEAQPLHDLLRRCELAAPVQDLRVGPAGSVEDVLWSIDALGAPSRLSFAGFPSGPFRVAFDPYPAQQLAAGPEPLPDAPTLLRRAVEVLSQGHGGEWDASRHVLILNLPSEEQLAALEEEGFYTRQDVVHKVARRLRLGGAQVVPAASVLVVECGDTSLSYYSDDRVVAAAIGAGLDMPLRLPYEAAPDARVTDWAGRRLPERGRPYASHEALRWGLQQVMEEAWNAAGDRSLRERLEWALGVRRELATTNVLPTFVAQS
ncbi:hypothetical protein HYH03_003219 [Edaphochlamys debaryana]|uniref:Uncharacterized protein n=1 Tax=Edaphochlamys debaryana TaxID=47281 RepID=A0A835YC71_9CHLO|nr:hypothetical protein HYH03_003219 [Edaphochlamys debaryana]|eukprot:KAG2499034.1 hypothetical protein HYH03_003219 [Edaphochlamys debaryana]